MNMSMDWLNSNAGGGDSYPGVFFGTIGQKIVGKIVGTPRTVDTKYGQRLIIEVVVAEGSTALKGDKGADGPVEAGETCGVWVKPGQLASAIKDAVGVAGAKGLAEGDTLAVQFVEEQDTGKPSLLKIYKAQYVAAKPAVAVGDLI